MKRFNLECLGLLLAVLGFQAGCGKGSAESKESANGGTPVAEADEVKPKANPFAKKSADGNPFGNTGEDPFADGRKPDGDEPLKVLYGLIFVRFLEEQSANEIRSTELRQTFLRIVGAAKKAWKSGEADFAVVEVTRNAVKLEPFWPPRVPENAPSELMRVAFVDSSRGVKTKVLREFPQGSVLPKAGEQTSFVVKTRKVFDDKEWDLTPVEISIGVGTSLDVAKKLSSGNLVRCSFNVKSVQSLGRTNFRLDDPSVLSEIVVVEVSDVKIIGPGSDPANQ